MLEFSTELFVDNVTEVEWVTMMLAMSTMSTVTDDDVGRTISYHHRVVVAVCCCGITVVGVLGNALVVASVLRFKKLQTITNILVLNLAIADLLTCLIIPFYVIGLVDRSGEYPLPDIVCMLIPGASYVSLAVSISTLAVIAVIRWYVITRSVRGPQGIYTQTNVIILALVLWIISLVVVITPPALGVGELGYSTYYSLCTVTDTNPLRGYYVFIQGVFIFVVLIITCIFYVMIFVYVVGESRKFRRQFSEDRVLTVSGDSAPTSAAKPDANNMISSLNKREIDITKNLFVVVCVFAICVLPNGVNFLIEGASVLTLYGAMISTANSAVNPIIYGLRHPTFQEAFKSFLRCGRPGKPTTSSGVKPRSTANTV